MSHGVVPPALAGRVNHKHRLSVADAADQELHPLLHEGAFAGPSNWRGSDSGERQVAKPILGQTSLPRNGIPSHLEIAASDTSSVAVASDSGDLNGGTGAAHCKAAPVACQLESLDYEEIENTVYRADLASTSPGNDIMYTFSKWFICLLIGVGTAMAAFFVNLSVENISNFKFWVTLTMMNRDWYIGSFLLYLLINGALVFLSVAITVYIGPAAAGSGIAEVKAFLNGIDVPGIFYVNTFVAKIVGAIGSVAGGLSIGKEGPFVHAGACIAALLSQGGGSIPRASGKGAASFQLPVFAPFWNDRDRADFVACGAAAGVAAAFRSPVGGLLFVLEEMTSWWNNQLLWLCFFTTAIVSVTVRVLMKACTGNGCGFFGSGGFIIFEIAQGQDNYEFYELLPMLLLGVMGGLLGSAFIVLNARLGRWRKKITARYGPAGKVADALIVSLITSTVSFIIPLIFSCQACPAEAGAACPRSDNSRPGNFVAFGCAVPSHYNGLATIFFNTQDDAIRNLFSSKTKREYTVGALTTFVTAFFSLAVVTYGVACPTGLFVPSILLGAAYGRLVGIFVADMHPSHYIDEGTYALLGAASFLGGAMRTTVSSCVMLLELTNNLALLPLVMLVLLVAKAVGDGTGVKSIYEAQLEVREMPFLGPHPTGFMRHVTAKEVAGKPAVTFQRVEKVGRIAKVLRSCQHNGFPIIASGVEGDKFIMGIILRHQLLVLLASQKAFQPGSHVTEAAGRVATTFTTPDFSKPISTPGLTVEGVTLSAENLEMWLDLGPYVNPSYYVVQEDASLSKVYTLFRTLGLRHVAVIPRATEVVGIITRRDLMPEVLERFTNGQYTTDGNNWHGMTSEPLALAPSLALPPLGETDGLLAGHAGGTRRQTMEMTMSPQSYHYQFDTANGVA